MRQVAEVRSGARRSAVDGWGPSSRMTEAAKGVTDAEVAEAARYFATMRAKRRLTIVERTFIPLTYEAGGLYVARAGVDTEPLGSRVMELTEDLHRHELHDPGETFIAYVPVGSIARGRRLATTKATELVAPCASCHGPTLRGVGAVPPLAGRAPSHL